MALSMSYTSDLSEIRQKPGLINGQYSATRPGLNRVNSIFEQDDYRPSDDPAANISECQVKQGSNPAASDMRVGKCLLAPNTATGSAGISTPHPYRHDKALGNLTDRIRF